MKHLQNIQMEMIVCLFYTGWSALVHNVYIQPLCCTLIHTCTLTITSNSEYFCFLVTYFFSIHHWVRVTTHSELDIIYSQKPI